MFLEQKNSKSNREFERAQKNQCSARKIQSLIFVGFQDRPVFLVLPGYQGTMLQIFFDQRF